MSRCVCVCVCVCECACVWHTSIFKLLYFRFWTSVCLFKLFLTIHTPVSLCLTQWHTSHSSQHSSSAVRTSSAANYKLRSGLTGGICTCFNISCLVFIAGILLTSTSPLEPWPHPTNWQYFIHRYKKTVLDTADRSNTWRFGYYFWHHHDNICQFIVLFLHVKWLQDGLLLWRGRVKSKYVQIIYNSARCHSFLLYLHPPSLYSIPLPLSRS